MNPLKIGNVIRVESGRVDVVITARDLNLLYEERTYRVGQLGSYVTIPMDERTIVGFVVGVGRQEVSVVDVELIGELRLTTRRASPERHRR